MDRARHVVRTAVRSSILCLLLATTAHAGGLSFVEYDQSTFPTINGLRGAVDVTVVDDYVYVIGAVDDAVSVWQRDFMTNALSFQQVVLDGDGGVSGLRNPTAIAGTVDGNCMYVVTTDNPSGPGGPGTVVVFNRSLFGGGLAYLETHIDGVAGVDGIGDASAIAIPLDDKHVYVASEHDDAIAIFSRTAPACGLTFVGMVQNGSGGVQGLDRPAGIAVSPDGANLYAAARTSNGKQTVGSVVVFDRNAMTGALTYHEHQVDGVAGVDRLMTPLSAITVAGFGDSVYVTSQGGDAVVAFTRNSGTGALTFLETERRTGLVKGIKGASGLVTSSSDDYLYVTGRGDDALAVFKRDIATGRLDFLEFHQEVVPDVNVLGGAEAVAVAPDFSGGVYVVGSRPDTVVTFNADRCGDGHLGTDEQCDDGCLASVPGLCEPADDGDGCSSSCRLELCGPIVTGTCHAATPGGGASLLIKNESDDRKDQVKWTWKGAMTPLAQYGDPVTTASYVLCIYDGSANPQPVSSRAAPVGGLCDGKPCWVAKPTSFQYSDKLLTPDGLKKTQLKEGLADGKPKVQVQGVGVFIDPPPLPLTLPVTVQVKNTQNGECWEASYSVANKNDAAKFTGKSD